MTPNLHGMGIAAMGVVALYLLCTAPFLPLLLYVHRMKSAYTGMFIAAMILQLIPIGLVFFPLGLVGVGMLAFTLVATNRRNSAFVRSRLPNPGVERRWREEYLANLVAFGFGLEQKSVALLFIHVTTPHGGLGNAIWALLPGSLLLWGVLGPLMWRETRALGALRAS